MKSDIYNDSLKKASALCSKSERCQYEIKQKLISWGLSNEEDIQSILKWLTDNNFINEARYAGLYSVDKHRLNKWGRIKIHTMLKQKGISDDDIEQGLASIDINEYKLNLEDMLRKKRTEIKAKNQFDLKSRLFRYAAQKGYENDLIYNIGEEVIR